MPYVELHPALKVNNKREFPHKKLTTFNLEENNDGQNTKRRVKENGCNLKLRRKIVLYKPEFYGAIAVLQDT